MKYISFLIYSLLFFFITGCGQNDVIEEGFVEDSPQGLVSFVDENVLERIESNQDIGDLIDVEQSTMSNLTSEEKKIQTNPNEFNLQFKENAMKDYISRNSDFAGFIQIEGTAIDYPVLKGNDNEFYLKHDFDKKFSKYGSIFMDYRNFGSGYDRNLILYGHNMKDDEMFGTLRYYLDDTYAREHQYISFEDLYSKKTYMVFAAYYSENDGDLIRTSFDDDTFESYLDQISERNVLDLDIPADGTKNILTLVTCSYEIEDGRYFVHAVEIDDEEMNEGR